MLNLFKNKKIALTKQFPLNFIDIHSHLLPGIDDGAKSLDESITLIKRMHEYGIKNFICTPHIMEGVWENTPKIIKQKLHELNNSMNSIGIHDITITAAAEYLLDNNFEKLLDTKDLLTLKDTKILVEMSYFNAPIHIYEILFKIQVKGYKPILAHPERYAYLHQNYTEFQKLKDAGCLFQLNLLSLSNYYGKAVQKTAHYLLKNNFIDFVGTDVHHNKHLDYLETINEPKILKLLLPILENNTQFISSKI
ncbi:MAG: histidinol phosphatase [Lutibacter sp.]|uniref:tyrosine-protein phosphatase n=1 Tax=Lutibacter sp. TaxID=1925666 RepID=UPI00385F359B